MVNISSLIQSKFIKASDLEGRQHLATITGWHLETMDDKKQKLALSLKEWDRDFLLNTTNTNNVAAFLGTETDNWIGKQIVMVTAFVDFQGKTVEAIRVRAPKTAQPVTHAAPGAMVGGIQRTPQGDPREFDDAVPF